MKKNVSGQAIGAEMITAADGTAFTGAVKAYRTINNGTQALGSVGLGICAHKGNGYHSYTPTAGETNGDHIAWTFIGTGAVPATIQVYTGFPQSIDNAIKLVRILGLVMENLVEDDIVRDAGGNKTSSTIYIYDSAANATTHDKATGLVASYDIAAGYTNNLMDLFKSIKA
jgi:hypothetical protein